MKDAETLRLLAIEESENGNYSVALEYFWKVAELEPDRSVNWYNLGVIYERLNNHLEAETQYKKALDIDPNYVDALNGLGNVYFNKKKFSEAETQYKKAFEIDPNDAYALNGLGYVYFKTKKYSEAETQYKKVLEIDPNFVDALNGLGNVYNNTNKYSEAETQYQKVLDIDPNNIHALIGLGNVYNNTNKYSEAETQYQKALDIDPNFVDALNGLGNVYFQTELYTKAITHYDTALQIEDNYSSYYGLGYCYFKKNPPNYALAQLNFTRFVYLAEDSKLNQGFSTLIPFFKDYADAPYLLKHLFERLPHLQHSLSYRAVIQKYERQCKQIDTYRAWVAYRPFYVLDIAIAQQQATLHTQESIIQQKGSSQQAIITAKDAVEKAKKAIAQIQETYNQEITLTPSPTIDHWRFEAMINFFMGHYAEAFRLYDEVIQVEPGYQVSLMDTYYYIEAAQNFLHPEANLYLTDALMYEVAPLVQHFKQDTHEVSELYYAAQLYFKDWQVNQSPEQLEIANRLFMRADYYPPAQYMAVQTNTLLGNKEQAQKQVEKIQKAKARWFAEGWRVRDFDLVSEDFLRQVKKYAHFNEIQEAIQLVHTGGTTYRFPPFYDAFELNLSKADRESFNKFRLKRLQHEIRNGLEAGFTLGTQQYGDNADALKHGAGDLSIFEEIDNSTDAQKMELALAKFIFAWKLNGKIQHKITVYQEVVMYAIVSQKINPFIGMRLIHFVGVVAIDKNLGNESKVALLIESFTYGTLIRQGATVAFDALLSGGSLTLAVNFITAFAGFIPILRKKLIGSTPSTMPDVDFYKAFCEIHLEYVAEHLEQLQSYQWHDDALVKDLKKYYESQKARFD